jgi:hypothetical protein
MSTQLVCRAALTTVVVVGLISLPPPELAASSPGDAIEIDIPVQLAPVEPLWIAHGQPPRIKSAPKLPPEPVGPRTIVLSPVTAIGDQTVLDTGALTTWMITPTCLLAGHDTMGWYWLDDIPLGTVLAVNAGPCAGRYEVTGHRWQPVKGGPIPDWMASTDLILQTCTGTSGMGFTIATGR